MMTDGPTLTPVTVTLEAGPTGAGSIDDLELFYARRAPGPIRDTAGPLGAPRPPVTASRPT